MLVEVNVVTLQRVAETVWSLLLDSTGATGKKNKNYLIGSHPALIYENMLSCKLLLLCSCFGAL